MNLYCWDNSTFYSISVNWNIRFPEDSKIAKFSHFSGRFLPDLVSVSASVQLLSHVWFVATPWTAARQASLSITNCWSLPNSCPLSQWCHPTISSSLVPFSCPQSFPASGSFQMTQLFASGGQSIEVSASTLVLPMTWFRVYLKKKKKKASKKNSSNEAINILVIAGYFLYSRNTKDPFSQLWHHNDTIQHASVKL